MVIAILRWKLYTVVDEHKMFQVTRLTGAFTYWESDIMKINPAVVMFKFLPLAMTFINFMTAFLFMNSCKSYLKLVNDTQSTFTECIYVNCTKTLVLSSTEKHIQSGTCNIDLKTWSLTT